MKIRVEYDDNTFGYVEDKELDYLISTNEIIRFMRSSGWVRVGVDKVRGHRMGRRRSGCLHNIYV